MRFFAGLRHCLEIHGLTLFLKGQLLISGFSLENKIQIMVFKAPESDSFESTKIMNLVLQEIMYCGNFHTGQEYYVPSIRIHLSYGY